MGFYFLIRPSELGKKIIENYNFEYPVLVAHRGASSRAPESTRPAMELALKSGIDYIEFDVQRSRDGKLIVFHDSNLLRLSNVKQVFPDKDSYDIHDFSLKELKKLNYGAWFNKKYPELAQAEYEDLDILTLEELLKIVDPVNSGVGLFLELKNPYLYSGIEAEITELLAKNNIYEKEDQKPNVLFLSFSPASLKRLKKLRPESPRILLTKRNFVLPKRWQGWLDITEEVADGLAPKGHVSFPWYIGAAHKRDLFVFPYVVNRSWQLKILSWFNADGYITDRIQLLTGFYDRAQEIGETVEEFGEEISELGPGDSEEDEKDEEASE